MTDEREQRRTVLPPAEAEGAASFAAPPGTDETPNAPDNVATRMEMGEPGTPDPTTSAAGDEGNSTGGAPAEDVAARRAGSEREAEAIRQQAEETSIDQRADV